VDLAPELPVLDGDSGKTAGVAVCFLSLRDNPLMSIVEPNLFLHLNRQLAAQVGLAALILCRYAPDRLRAILGQGFFVRLSWRAQRASRLRPLP
jgi:hypothetical protein